MEQRNQLGPGNREWVIGSWLNLSYATNPTIRLDASVLDRVLADDQDLILTSNDFTLALPITGAVARDLAEAMAPYTRTAPIIRPEVYEVAKQRLEEIKGRGPNARPAAMFVANEPVIVSNEIVYVGSFHCRISDVARYSSVRAAIPLPNGWLQAGLVMLVVADRYRTQEYSGALALRIAEYEKCNARGAADVADAPDALASDSETADTAAIASKTADGGGSDTSDN